MPSFGDPPLFLIHIFFNADLASMSHDQDFKHNFFFPLKSASILRKIFYQKFEIFLCVYFVFQSVLITFGFA